AQLVREVADELLRPIGIAAHVGILPPAAKRSIRGVGAQRFVSRWVRHDVATSRVGASAVATHQSSASSWKWFAGWLLVGVLWALAVAGVFTIGIFVLPIAIGATVLLARRHADASASGLLLGASVVVLRTARSDARGMDGPALCVGPVE